MAVMNAGLTALSHENRQVVESWLFEFDRDWHEGRLAEQVRKLPPPGSQLRLAALIEMVKIDLEKQWQHGRKALVEGYLRAYPELGAIDTAPADLILKEYEVRQAAGDSPRETTLVKRFPQQAEQLRPLLEQAKQSGTRSKPALQSKETPRSDSPQRNTPHTPGVPPGLPERFGRYVIRKRLGQGGMGSVYLAHDTELDRDVALKVPHLSTADGPEVLERFYREARAAATLQHSCICPVHDVGQVDNIPYLTMSYIEGQPLSKIIERGKTLSPRSIAELVRKLALALQEAHGKGIVHRDLKPSNIMINKRGEPVVMDFGLVLRVDNAEARLTKSGSALGTPAYMPPEQVRGATTEMGPACDIYSLGVILYELLSGQLPFEGPYMAVCAQILTQEAPPPSSHRPDVDRKLEAICLKAMGKKPAERHPSTAKLAAELADYLRQGNASESKTRESATVLPAPVSRKAAPPPKGAEPATAFADLRPGSVSEVVTDPGAYKSRWRFARGPWIAVACAAVLLLLGTVIYITTDYGTVQIVLSDPKAKVQIEVDGDTIDITGIDKPVRLKVGKHNLKVTGEGFETVAESYTVKRGANPVWTVTLQPMPAIASAAANPGRPVDAIVDFYGGGRPGEWRVMRDSNNNVIRRGSVGLSPDGLELTICDRRPGSLAGHVDLYLLRRDSLAKPFGEAIHLREASSTDHDYGPMWFSEDGLQMYFNRRSSVIPPSLNWHAQFFVTSRRTKKDIFGSAQPVSGLPRELRGGAPVLSTNGRIIFYFPAEGNFTAVYRGVRDNVNEPFQGKRTTLPGWYEPTLVGINVLAVSDESALVFTWLKGDRVVLASSRPKARNEEYEEPTVLLDLDFPPVNASWEGKFVFRHVQQMALSRDARLLFSDRDGEAWVMRLPEDVRQKILMVLGRPSGREQSTGDSLEQGSATIRPARQVAEHLQAGSRWVGIYKNSGTLPGDRSNWTTDVVLIVRKRKGTDVAFELWQNNEARGKLGEGTVDSKGNITVTWVKIIKGDWGPADVGLKMPFGRVEGKKWTLKPARGGDGRIREFDAKLEE